MITHALHHTHTGYFVPEAKSFIMCVCVCVCVCIECVYDALHVSSTGCFVQSTGPHDNTCNASYTHHTNAYTYTYTHTYVHVHNRLFRPGVGANGTYITLYTHRLFRFRGKGTHDGTYTYTYRSFISEAKAQLITHALHHTQTNTYTHVHVHTQVISFQMQRQS